MTALFSPLALLPDGWSENVRLTIGPDGKISHVETGLPSQSGDIRLTGRVLLPALANIHSHSFQRAMAGLTECRGPGRGSFWTWRRLMYQFLERLDPDQIEAIAGLAFIEMLEAGYASVGEFHYLHHQPGGRAYDNPAETSARIAAAAAQSGIGLTHLPVLYMQGGVDGRKLEGGQLRFGNSPGAFAGLVQAVEKITGALAPDARVGLALHSLRAVPPEALAPAATMQEGPVHIHIAEQRAEIEDITATLGAPPVAWLLANAEVNARWTLVHATHMTPDETTGLARSGAVAGLCPVTEANLGDGIFDGARFLEAGGQFGIGSDCNVRISVAEELRGLEYSQRLKDQRRAVLCAEAGSTGRTLYDGALAGGARALGRKAGAIETGRWADLVALDWGSLTLDGLTGDAVLDAWLFVGDDRLVSDVWSAGRHVVKEGRHVKRATIEKTYRACLTALRNDL